MVRAGGGTLGAARAPEACCIEEVARRQRARLAEERLELERRRQEQRLAHFAGIGCYPDPQPSCHNRTCYYDETCQLHPPRAGGLGCWAAKLDVRCRYCGFAHYDACPEDGDRSGRPEQLGGLGAFCCHIETETA